MTNRTMTDKRHKQLKQLMAAHAAGDIGDRQMTHIHEQILLGNISNINETLAKARTKHRRAKGRR